MATATIETIATFRLKLSEDERDYLLGVLQNDLSDRETTKGRHIREGIYKALANPEAEREE